jgi:hypothetical protein
VFRPDVKESHKEEEYSGYGKPKQPTLYSPEAEYVTQGDDSYSGQKEQRGTDYVAMPPSKWDHPG